MKESIIPTPDQLKKQQTEKLTQQVDDFREKCTQALLNGYRVGHPVSISTDGVDMLVIEQVKIEFNKKGWSVGSRMVKNESFIVISEYVQRGDYGDK